MDENAIRNLFKEFETAFNRHDPNAIASCWTEDCDHIDPDGAEAKGRAEMQRLATEKHNSVFRGSNIKVNIQRVRELSPDIVQVDGTWELSNARTPDGRTIATMPGRCSAFASGMAIDGACTLRVHSFRSARSENTGLLHKCGRERRTAHEPSSNCTNVATTLVALKRRSEPSATWPPQRHSFFSRVPDPHSARPVST